jgi:hypothetical protein
MTKLRTLLATTVLALAASACATSHTHSVAYNGVPGIRGEAVEFQSTTRYALHLVFLFGLLGDASQSATVDSFTEEASSRGAKRIQITQYESTTYWYIFPPISFLVHPVASTVYGEVEGTVGSGQ